jgi:ribosomal protein S27E
MTDTPDVTSVAAVVTVTSPPATDIPAATPPQTNGPTPGSIAPELIAAGALILLILGYIALYLRGAATASQYAGGFVIDKCPVCREGNLTVESRTERSLGIPNTKHVVRCDNCRSVIRESGGGRWRYAVDRAVNPAMYDRLNNREIREDTLKRLLDAPESGPSRVNPEIVDDEPQP